MHRPIGISSYKGQLISVIIPYYNEKVDILKKTIQSCIDSKGNKEIIVVDDGSSDKAIASKIKIEFGSLIKFVRYEANLGKRKAQAVGVKCADGEFIVTVDSDTVIDNKALVTLISPMLAKKEVGATTGNVEVLNLKENLLTRMIASRYWNAFNVERKSLSGFGIVTCCSGVLSAYRAELFKSLIPLYTGQRFLGEECTYGDDRHLTNLVLERKYRIEYVEEAVCYTEVPSSMKQFIKQQLRWKKSFIRESIITLRYAFKHSFLLPIEVLFNLLIPFMGLAIRLSIVMSMILFPHYILLFIASVSTVAIIRNFFMFVDRKDLALYSIPYAFIHEFVIFWLYFIAIFKLKDKSWGTR